MRALFNVVANNGLEDDFKPAGVNSRDDDVLRLRGTSDLVGFGQGGLENASSLALCLFVSRQRRREA